MGQRLHASALLNVYRTLQCMMVEDAHGMHSTSTNHTVTSLQTGGLLHVHHHKQLARAGFCTAHRHMSAAKHTTMATPSYFLFH